MLDVLASPAHDLSLARALKSPLFDATDDDLLRLSLAARAAGAPWLEALVAAQPAPFGSSALQRAGTLLSGWRTACRTPRPDRSSPRFPRPSSTP